MPKPPASAPRLYADLDTAIAAHRKAGKDLLVRVLPRPGLHPSNAQTYLLRTTKAGVSALPQSPQLLE